MSSSPPSQPGQPKPETHQPPAYTISPTLLASPFAQSPAAYLAINAPITDILASAAVFFHHGPELKLLLVQRAPTDFFPLKWELPGGSVDPDDASVIAGAVRELREETGLRATGVRRWIGNREFPEGDGVRWWRQGIFEVVVDGELGGKDEAGYPVVRLDPAEHVDYRWVTAEDVKEGKCGEIVLEYTDPAWQQLLLRALELHALES